MEPKKPRPPEPIELEPDQLSEEVDIVEKEIIDEYIKLIDD